MAYTQADIDTLRQALLDRKGAIEMTFDGQTVRFESADAIRTQIATMEAALSVTAGTTRTRVAATRKGV